MNWRPIETAPTDGTPILATDGEECMVVACNFNEAMERFTGWYCVAYDMAGLDSATHWMPLPETPR